jgi:hypothetical protein
MTTPPTLFINYSTAEDFHDYRHRQQALSYVGKYIRNGGTRRRRVLAGASTQSGSLGSTTTPGIVDQKLSVGLVTTHPDARPLIQRDKGDTYRPPAPEKCLPCMGASVKPISGLDGSVLRYYVEQALAATYSFEFAELYDRTVSSHRFFPILQETVQVAVQQEILVLEGLIADTAYLMAAMHPELKDSLMIHGHKSTNRALNMLRSRLANGDSMQSLEDLHAVLHLCMGAFNCGDMASARLHLKAFEAILSANHFEGVLFQCLLETARMYDVYLLLYLGPVPVFHSEWTSEFLASIALLSKEVMPTNRGRGRAWWQEHLTITMAPDASPRSRGFGVVQPNKLYDGIDDGIIPDPVSDVVKLYTAARSALARCFTDRKVKAEHIETAHKLNVVCLHRLACAYIAIQEKLRQPAQHSLKRHKVLLLMKCLLLAMQLVSLRDEGPLVQGAAVEKRHELSRSLWPLRLPAVLATLVDSQHGDPVSDRHRAYMELLLWMMLVAVSQLHNKEVTPRQWLDKEICRMVHTLGCETDEAYGDVIAQYTFSKQEHTYLLRAIQDAIFRQNDPDKTGDKAEWAPAGAP